MTDSLQFSPVVQTMAGLLLLLLGRRLFWVFVGAIGFFVGSQIATVAMASTNDATVLGIALAGGIVGALLSLFLQRLAVMVAGGLALGMMAMRMAPLIGLHLDAGMAVAFIFAALLGAVLVNVIFGPALIVISSVTGAVMIAEALPLDGSLTPLLIVPLTVVGVLLQARATRGPVAVD